MNIKSVRNYFLYIFGYLIVQKIYSRIGNQKIPTILIFHYQKKYLPNDKKTTLKKMLVMDYQCSFFFNFLQVFLHILKNMIFYFVKHLKKFPFIFEGHLIFMNILIFKRKKKEQSYAYSKVQVWTWLSLFIFELPNPRGQGFTLNKLNFPL